MSVFDRGAVRSPGAHELDAVASCIEAAFLFHFAPAEREAFLSSLEAGRPLVALADGGVIGTLLSHHVELTLPGPVVAEANALTDIAVLPTHRGRGVLGALLECHFAEAKEAGEALCLLEPSGGGLYGRFGFGPASFATSYRLELPAPLLQLGEGAREEEEPLLLLGRGEARSVLPAVFELVRKSSVGEVSREPSSWEALLSGEERGARFFLAHAPGGVVDAYAVYDAVAGEGGAEIHLRELLAESAVGYRALWRYLVSLEGPRRLLTSWRPSAEVARHLLADPRALVSGELRDRSWLRLLDVAAALVLRGYSGEGSLVLRVLDERCPWNAGNLLLESDGEGRAAVGATRKAPELSIGAGELASLFLGAGSAALLWGAGRLEELKAGAVARTDALFSVSPPPFQSSEL